MEERMRRHFLSRVSLIKEAHRSELLRQVPSCDIFILRVISGSPATPAESPTEAHSHWATHKAVGPTPSHQPGPETADGAENMASGTAAGGQRRATSRPLSPARDLPLLHTGLALCTADRG
ncbi:uncharacterized protein AAG666_004364 isoform 1-T1 [Megaptera novaeangliae]